ncbi:MAG: ABC transporter ATP-binding protein [Lachnospiraceae bacterium]|nr:ABC transporter ATP-binding protein [Lachnospiraceae bacterium]
MKQTTEISIRPYTKEFYRGNGIYFLLAMVQTVLATFAELSFAWLLQQVIDLTTGTDVGFTLTELTLLAIGVLVVQLLAFGFAYLSKPRFLSKAIEQYKTYVFEKISRKGIQAFTSENTSLYVSALSNDAASIESNYLANLFLMIDSIVIFFGALFMMFWYNPTLTLISIALSLLPLVAALTTGNLVAKAEKQVSDRNETYMSTLRDSLAGFSVIKSFRAEVQICRIYVQKIREVSGAKCLRRKMSILVQMLSASAGAIVQIGIFLIGAYLALSGKAVSAGSMIAFVQLLNYVVNPISTIPECLAERKAARALIEKLAIALEENVREEGTTDKNILTDRITLQNLSFAYEKDTPVLENINLRFEKGKSYALVGASGSGKSTLLNLLMASHTNYSGSILYDTVELRDITTRTLYDMVSVIQQNVFIFNASIRDNITMFASFPKHEVDLAIEQSGLSELIAKYGEEYLCGENGSGLSGGEKQRISIARSLLKNSQVLLVDEATAALDAETAYHVSSAILGLKNITRIVITHALDRELLQQYDEIIVLKNGTVEEQGDFNSLMAKKNYFFSLFTIAQ